MHRVLSLTTAALCAALLGDIATAQEGVRFDRPIFTMDGTVLCARQGDVTMLRRAAEGDDRAGFERIASAACKLPGPDIRLAVIARPGLYDPDVEVRVASAPDLDASLPRGKMWTLKSMVRN